MAVDHGISLAHIYPEIAVYPYALVRNVEHVSAANSIAAHAKAVRKLLGYIDLISPDPVPRRKRLAIASDYNLLLRLCFVQEFMDVPF